MSIEDSKRKQGNPLWIPGKSGNPEGKRKGARRNIKTTIARFLFRNGSLKELQANYILLKPGKERLEFILKLMPYHIAPVTADSLTQQEIEQLYEKLEQKIIGDVEGKKAV